MSELLSLRITEIFRSLQGESGYVGLPTSFVRLTGCPLRCVYCDTAYAFTGGKKISFDEILMTLQGLGAPYVCVTGGEPLAQPDCHKLLTLLADEGYFVSLETSGAFSIAQVDKRVKCIIDIKTPGSQESSKNCLENLSLCKEQDEFKFVLMDRNDFDWAVDFCKNSLQHVPTDRILFSPSYETLNPTDLANWIVQEKVNVRMQIQLHKILWGEKQGV